MSLMQLGARAFEEIGGEVVQTVVFVIRNGHEGEYLSTCVDLTKYSTLKDKEIHFF